MGNTELLCTQCRGTVPHLVARVKSHSYSRVAAGPWGIISSYNGEGPSKLVFVQQRQDSCLVPRDTSGFSSRPRRGIGTLLKLRREPHAPFPVDTGILGFLSIFSRSQASSPFETLNSACLWSCQRYVKPPVEMKRGPSAFFRVSTGDSDNPSSFEIKDEPEFKQGNPAFF